MFLFWHSTSDTKAIERFFYLKSEDGKRRGNAEDTSTPWKVPPNFTGDSRGKSWSVNPICNSQTHKSEPSHMGIHQPISWKKTHNKGSARTRRWGQSDRVTRDFAPVVGTTKRHTAPTPIVDLNELDCCWLASGRSEIFQHSGTKRRCGAWTLNLNIIIIFCAQTLNLNLNI